MSGEIRFVQGNEACVRGALYAGVRFFAGYPITPSTEIAEHLSEELPRVGGRFVQMEDEIASHVRRLRRLPGRLQSHDSHVRPRLFPEAGGPGLRHHGRDPLRHRRCAARRPLHGPAHGMLPGRRDAGALGAHGDHAIIALTASSIQDVFSMTVEAFNLAETYRTPVVLLFDEVIGHMREKLEIRPPASCPWWNASIPTCRKG